MVTRIEINVQTGAITEIEVDDAYIIAHRSKTLLLTASSLSVAVNGTISLSAQLRTPQLSDGSYSNLTDNLSLVLHIGDVTQTINLVNGAWSDTLLFSLAGAYLISCEDLPTNSLTVTCS